MSQFTEHSAIQNEHLCERTLVYCVSPPGENMWSKEAHNSNAGMCVFYYKIKKLNIVIDCLVDQLQRLELKEPNQTTLKKFPLPDQDHTAAIIKFYNDMAESIKVGQLVEVIGIRGQDIQKQQDEHSGFDSVLDLFSDVPVIHAIAYSTLDAINSSPMSEHEDISNLTHDIRSQLIDYLSCALGGDKLAAEFVLLQLLSRV
jgi:DNA replicative helicase MCM subunit Mcm2 (Cdc46/Mcm family)